MLDQGNIAPAEVAEETVPNTLVLLRVWWAMAWRQFFWFVVVFAAFTVMSVIIGIIIAFIGVDQDSADAFDHTFGLVMGTLGNIWAFVMAFRQLLGKEFSGHKILFLTSKERV